MTEDHQKSFSLAMLVIARSDVELLSSGMLNVLKFTFQQRNILLI